MFKNINSFNTDKMFDKSLSSLNRKFKGVLKTNSEITPKDMLNFVIHLMQSVEKSKMNGSSKKEMVIKLMEKVVSDNKNNIENLECIQNFIKITLPSLIDTLISLDRKESFIKHEYNFMPSCCCI
jgi:ribosomal protein S3AE